MCTLKESTAGPKEIPDGFIPHYIWLLHLWELVCFHRSVLVNSKREGFQWGLQTPSDSSQQHTSASAITPRLLAAQLICGSFNVRLINWPASFVARQKWIHLSVELLLAKRPCSSRKKHNPIVCIHLNKLQPSEKGKKELGELLFSRNKWKGLSRGAKLKPNAYSLHQLSW